MEPGTANRKSLRAAARLYKTPAAAARPSARPRICYFQISTEVPCPNGPTPR